MDIDFSISEPENWRADVAILFCCEQESISEICPELDNACPWLAIAPGLRDFKAQKDELAVFYGHPEAPLSRVLAIGLGKQSEIKSGDVRLAAGQAARLLKKLGLATALLPVTQFERLPGGSLRLVEDSVCGFLLGLYEFDKYKTKKDQTQANPQTLSLAMSAASEAVESASHRAESAAKATALARDLANEPGNSLYPEILALRAISLAQEFGFKCEVLNEDQLKAIGAGCLLAVGQGSIHPPRLICLEYAASGHEADQPLGLVGKGLTFDSGGLCLKPAANMDQMKCDMSGAAAVLAAMTAIAREKLPLRVVGILACAENMPDGTAFRPGDILNALNGETVEVINTDAEGRLALADGLAYIQKKYEPKVIIDIATLTGACAVALGNNLAGLFGSDDQLAAKIEAVGAAIGENYWRLPLWQPYCESLKSNIADIKHTASREGGAITAALFLKNFVDDAIPWLHLDIAGVDWVAKASPLCPEGASGFGARTLLEFARRQVV